MERFFLIHQLTIGSYAPLPLDKLYFRLGHLTERLEFQRLLNWHLKGQHFNKFKAQCSQ